MKIRDFLKAGQTPSLFSAFLFFDISFMVWVLLGALANSIVPDPNFQLNETQRGLMIAVPLLGGAVLRLVLGTLTDYIGPRKTGLIGLGLTYIPLLLGWLWADNIEKIMVVGALLGVAGASFAVALPLASRWYPPQYQGLAMGIAGAGNSGTALATLFVPLIARQWGWHSAFAIAIIPFSLTTLVFYFCAKDSPNQPAPKPFGDYLKVLGQRDTWWFCLFYSVTFGGFVGLASFLNSFFKVQYDLDPVMAGMFATICVVAGSLMRPIGGFLADRFGGIRMLVVLYSCVLITMLGLGVFVTPMGLELLPNSLYVGTALMFLCMGSLGLGNGSVFQLVPLRFPKEIGVMTGIVGAAGGVGGFFLPTVLGLIKDQTGSFAGGFFLFGASGLVCAAAIVIVARCWVGVFVTAGGRAVTDVVMEPVTPSPAT
ncbi:MAG: NarK/NasA family nitrate transporter [Gemmataceae bacterium]|nr:NarK/NasA family nitrate transporter [Gemmataceae bacterium]